MVLPNRKSHRLQNYDYSQSGYYFVTICVKNREPLLGAINVGRGLAPAGVSIQRSPIGIVVEQQLFELESRYDFVKIDKYVIMPNHIHFILVLADKAAGASPRPTLTDIICAYKSLTTRICNQNDKVRGRVIFQTSFYEKVIRDERGYREVWEYIDENPLKWREDELFNG